MSKNTELLRTVQANLEKGGSRKRVGASVFATRGKAQESSRKIETETIIHIDPSDCTMYSEHDRDLSLLTPENTKDLIGGIAKDGQLIPVMVRQNQSGTNHKYEIICGARRHYAVTTLRDSDPVYSELLLRARVYNADDKTAFKMSDQENRAREDISDYERAVKYSKALGVHFQSQKEMAEDLSMDPATLSRFIQLANMPEEVASCFHSLLDIKIQHTRYLGPFIKSDKIRQKLILVAQDVEVRQKESEKPLDGPTVIKLLVEGMKEETKKKKEPGKKKETEKTTMENELGEKVMIVSKKRGARVVVEIIGENDKEVIEMLAELLKDHQ